MEATRKTSSTRRRSDCISTTRVHLLASHGEQKPGIIRAQYTEYTTATKHVPSLSSLLRPLHLLHPRDNLQHRPHHQRPPGMHSSLSRMVLGHGHFRDQRILPRQQQQQRYPTRDRKMPQLRMQSRVRRSKNFLLPELDRM